MSISCGNQEISQDALNCGLDDLVLSLKYVAQNNVSKTISKLFTDTSFNNDEWNQFLDSELNNSEIDSDFSKVNANDLAVLVKPLQTSKSSTEVINKTVTALSKPFLQVILNESDI